MIHDIYPSRLDNSFACNDICDNDHVMCFSSDGKILVDARNEKIVFPNGSDAVGAGTVYAFSVDDEKFFIALTEIATSGEEFTYMNLRELRDRFSGKELFAAFTAYHIWKWYTDNVFCGKCGSKLVFHESERAMRCEKCGNIIYPRINPAVIVGVTKGDSILITRYRRGYSHNALVAGFTEIGETLEQTVEREVMEETGVKVKNIRYYKSQPWGLAQDMLVGFFCEADGDGDIHMDENELKYAEWVKREDIVLQPNNASLTNEMMRVFKDGTVL